MSDPACGLTIVHPAHVYDGHLGCRGRAPIQSLVQKFTAEDVADGVPGADEGYQSRREQPRRDPREPVPADPLVAESAAREVGESLDVPDDSKGRQQAVDSALDPLYDLLLTMPRPHRSTVRAALEQAYDAGQADCARFLSDQADGPEVLDVEIKTLRCDDSPFGYWTARRVRIDVPEADEVRTVYRLDGDPNSVAVGRFKASLRRFLGV